MIKSTERIFFDKAQEKIMNLVLKKMIIGAALIGGFVGLSGCGGGSSSEATLGVGEGGVSAASSVSAVSATE